ncbi:MAG: CoA transferase [Hydrocarboniphaga sp.]|uniref:CaiB/BaiF CoA transferase family protein n=1 Tax=Hydrocarboniphaga sp. TaxID=2033016 RepID=UPI0026371468|nr:CaiB/BaiF CoA-transferase family protein [Hydrocarboniphaga sp.]MDB5971472.1 CoA transferase [Hydrocarboniphaga sp.]
MIRTGPLAGVRVLEIQGIGPGPFAAMTLADLGANVLRVARPGQTRSKFNPVLDRGRCAQVAVDMKTNAGRERLLDLVGQSEVLIEGYRPGVMERLGLGPDDCLARNPKLIYGRITGWGRSGPLADTAGHDINYIALSGALHACGTAESGPVPPLNLVGDFGGGGLLLALGIACALFESRGSGTGQVVDAAMVDGASMLMSMIYGLRANGRWPAARAGNILDGSAYFYTCYPCADGAWVAVGAIEPDFRIALFEGLGIADEAKALMQARDDDPQIRARIAAIFAGRTREQWQQVFDGSDACVTPVLSIDEAADHPHNIAWGSLRRVAGANHPTPAPRFSRTPPMPPDAAFDIAAQIAQWQLGDMPVQPIG